MNTEYDEMVLKDLIEVWSKMAVGSLQEPLDADKFVRELAIRHTFHLLSTVVKRRASAEKWAVDTLAKMAGWSFSETIGGTLHGQESQVQTDVLGSGSNPVPPSLLVDEFAEMLGLPYGTDILEGILQPLVKSHVVLSKCLERLNTVADAQLQHEITKQLADINDALWMGVPKVTGVAKAQPIVDRGLLRRGHAILQAVESAQ